MCIFCGGQCGGVGEFFISLGLPFLVLYFFRIKNALLKIKARFFPGAAAAKPLETETGGCCGERSGAGGALAAGSIAPATSEELELVLPERSGPQGVRGWLLFFYLNLTIIIPFSYLYQANCVLKIFYTPGMQILLVLFKKSLLYNIISITSWLLLAVFSFYTGLSLRRKKPKAVRVAKAFLITQLSVMFIIIIIRPFMEFSLESDMDSVFNVLKALIPFFAYFSFWYVYLSFSRRVRNTYGSSGAGTHAGGLLAVPQTSKNLPRPAP